MKENIHPTYFPEARVTCACGETWTVGSTKKEIRVDICSACHPFFTGEQRIVDTEGQVDRFYKRLEARQQYVAEKESRETSKTSPNRLLEEFEVAARATKLLVDAGLATAGDLIAKLEEGGDEAVLAIDGFGRKSLADFKKAMRRMGYELPGEEA
ncbi:MAG: 50S ribosomal protein L31 [Anaerolineales bacterium]|nr:50S ribosomal protein L31 [Anaerolineales bacterium]